MHPENQKNKTNAVFPLKKVIRGANFVIPDSGNITRVLSIIYMFSHYSPRLVEIYIKRKERLEWYGMWDRQLKSEIKVCVTLGCLRWIIFLERSAGLFLNECRRARRTGGESGERKKATRPAHLVDAVQENNKCLENDPCSVHWENRKSEKCLDMIHVLLDLTHQQNPIFTTDGKLIALEAAPFYLQKRLDIHPSS